MKKNFFFFLLCVVTLFISCDDCNKEDIIPRKESVVPEKAYLALSRTEVNAKGEGGYYSLKITSNVDWVISDIPDWCKTYTLNRSSDGDYITPILSGSADSTVVVIIKENNTVEKRMANLKIVGEGIELRLPIIQEGRLIGGVLDAPRHAFDIYPGLHFDGDFYLNEGAVLNPLIIQGYNEKIRVDTKPTTIDPFKGSPSLADILDYINNMDKSKTSKIQAKTLISVSELRTGDDFLREKNMMLNNPYSIREPYARVVINIKKTLFTLDVKPIIVEDEDVKIKLLNESKNSLYISSVTYGYRKSFVFGVDVDKVETVVRKINDCIENGNYAMVESYVTSLSSSYFAVYGISIPFSLEELITSAKSENLFNSDSRIVPISWRVKRAISNEPW